jgi:hypothetical protein
MLTSRETFKLLLALALCAAAPAQAKLLSAHVDRLDSGAGSLRDVRLSLDWPDGAKSGSLRIRAEALDFPSISYRARRIDWQCPLQRNGASGGWRCAGLVSADGSPRQRLALEFSAQGSHASLGIGASGLDYRSSAATPGRSSLQLQQVPVAWLKPFLAGLWAQGRWTGGRLDGSVEVLTPKSGPLAIKTDLGLSDVGLETPDGLLAAAALKGRLQLDYRELRGQQSVDASFTGRGGELLFNSLYVQFPASPVTVQLQARRDRPGAGWRLPTISWRDPGVLGAEGHAVLDAQSALAELDLALEIADLGKARDRYLSGFLAPAGFADTVLSGQLGAHLRLRGSGLDAIEARFGNINVVDPKARFTVAGIDGKLNWSAGAAAAPSSLRWANGALFGIGLGPAQFQFGSAQGQLRLGAPVTIDVLQGKLLLEHLRWQAPRGSAGATLEFGMAMQAMDLASLSQRLGWPAFTGTVSGRIPSARLAHDVLSTDGGLQMKLFGGSIELQDLSMERPFGTAPTLSANVQIQDMDLEPMTRVFGFGSISGRLDGRIDQLRLVNWSPVAFDARFDTDRAWKGKQRISQRAIDDISSVGGSGLVGGVQTQVLKLFDDFGYARIGIGCKLRDNVCTMDGIGSAGDGYTIVQGAGLPRIQVVGFRRKVDWPTLVSRLKAATEGQAPVIK